MLANFGQVGPELGQDLGGDTLALADEAQQDVLGADVVVAQLQGLAQRQLEHLLRPRGERDVAAGQRGALADDLLDLLADPLQGDAERFQRTRRHTLALVDEAQQDVLGADVVVVQQPRLFLGQDDHPASTIRESLEHRLLPLSSHRCDVGRSDPTTRPVRAFQVYR